jgi:hypothetical protein
MFVSTTDTLETSLTVVPYSQATAALTELLTR